MVGKIGQRRIRLAMLSIGLLYFLALLGFALIPQWFQVSVFGLPTLSVGTLISLVVMAGPVLLAWLYVNAADLSDIKDDHCR